MDLLVYARQRLADTTPPGNDRALLLEGDWSQQADSASFESFRDSLDSALDGQFDWIDRRASDLAEMLASQESSALPDALPRVDTSGGHLGKTESLATWPSAAYLNALRLRYYFVKLLRVIAYFTEVLPLRAGDCLCLFAERRDCDYVDLLGQLCGAANIDFRVEYCKARTVARNRERLPKNGVWRRAMGKLASLSRCGSTRRESGLNIVFCGNPRLLDPVCGELLARRHNAWWLYDRFALRSWWRWRSQGVEQLVCDGSVGEKNGFANQRLLPTTINCLTCRNINLANAVDRWLADRVDLHGAHQTRVLEQMDFHFRRVRPDVLVLDEDATPFARAAVSTGRMHHARSLVVQHGAPCCRFGFVPAVADRLAVWGSSSRDKFIEWGLPADRIALTGAPTLDALLENMRPPSKRNPLAHPNLHIGSVHSGKDVIRGRLTIDITTTIGIHTSSRANRENPTRKGPKLLLLATSRPRDSRPDAVGLNLNSRTYSEMLRLAFAAVAGIDDAELVVKLHPRANGDPIVDSLRQEFRSLRCRVVANGALGPCLAGTDCALSCGSTAGVEAALVGVPVIQLTPPGATEFLPHDRWAIVGTARTERELRCLLVDVLLKGQRAPTHTYSDVFATADVPSTVRIVDEVLRLAIGKKRELSNTASYNLPVSRHASRHSSR